MISSQINSIKIIQFFFISILLSACQTDIQQNEHPDDILWYDHPASKWEEALPLGNGRLGVMVFGDPSTEQIQLNDDSLWPSDLGWDEPAGNSADLEYVRSLLFQGKNTEADSIFVERFSRKRVLRSHQTLGYLHLDLGHENISDYRRELNLSKATASVTYKSNGQDIKQEVYVSHPHQVIIVELSTKATAGLNAQIRLNRPDDKGQPTVAITTTEDDHLIMRGEVTQRGAIFDSNPAPILEGVQFETRLKINNEGGEILRGKDYLQLQKVRKAIIYLVSNSSYYHSDYAGQNRADLNKVLSIDPHKLKADHIKDHQNFYSRVTLKLTEMNTDTIPTDRRLQRIKKGVTDPGLEALLFQYGRYLLIASSRPGTNPANLQGLWNQHIEAPWNADYHLNINLQMNYWPADVTNLGELNNPLFDYIDKLIENGKTTAAKNFGCRGAFMPHASDLWAPTWIRAATAYWGSSFGAGGWMLQHYWRHFEFTSDTVFLRNRVFPALTEVATFYSDWIIEDTRDGSLISAPSTSPENRYINANGKSVATCLGSAMDQQVIAEVFDHYIRACQILQMDDPLLTKIKAQRVQLRPGFVIGSDGRILEWDREYEEPEPGHRHMSHLYGFHPGNAVTKDKTPEMFKAVRRTLDYRLENGGAGTGWSRAWLINCSARLLDGDMAYDHIQLLFQKSLYDNLFDAHPPFQIDGNFGYTAGIAEMLVQSHEENTVRILPALPTAWKEGYVKGLNAQGGLTVDIHWKNNFLEKVIFYSKFDRQFDINYNDHIVPIKIAKNKTYTYKHS